LILVPGIYWLVESQSGGVVPQLVGVQRLSEPGGVFEGDRGFVLAANADELIVDHLGGFGFGRVVAGVDVSRFLAGGVVICFGWRCVQPKVVGLRSGRFGRLFVFQFCQPAQRLVDGVGGVGRVGGLEGLDVGNLAARDGEGAAFLDAVTVLDGSLDDTRNKG
jgi:hypothetical protein